MCIRDSKRGDPAKALRMSLKGNNDASTKVILWGKDETSLPKVISQNSKVLLLGVRTKMGNQGLEIHGNDGTMVEVEGSKEIEPIILRIAAKTKNEQGKTTALGINDKKNMVYVSDSVNMLESINIGDVVECMPSQVYGNSLTIDSGSLVRKIEDDGTLSTLSDLRTKISEIKSGNEYCVEAIILKEPERRDVQTKAGETISLGEMFVEDTTGQIWIKGWRNQAKLLDGLSRGEVISVTSVNAKAGLEGRTELFLTPSSTVNKKFNHPKNP